MISMHDILGMCDLDVDEIDAIAEHEHIPEVVAAALGDYLMHQARGVERVHAMIVEDIRVAIGHKDGQHAASLVVTLQHFLTEHPMTV